MAETVISDAVRYPQDEGLPNIADDNETWDSAGYVMAMAQAVDSDSYVRSDSELTFTGHDGTNDTVDVTGGVAYLDLSGISVDVQSTVGGDDPPAYDRTMPSLPAITVIVPTTVTGVAVQDSTLSSVWLAYDTDGTGPGSAGSVYVRSDDTGSVTAPSHPSVELGQANPDDASADSLGPRFGSPEFDSVTSGSVDTDSIDSVADSVIFVGDDAEGIIEGASAGDTLFIETGAHSISANIDFPQNIALVAFGGSQSGEYANLQKEFNGTLATLANNLFLQGVYFNGNKGSGFTGDGAVDPTGTSHITAVRSRFGNHAGDGRVHDESYWHDYHHCRFDTNDGWGVRTKDTNSGSHSSQISYEDWCFFRSNGSGGILYDDVTDMISPHLSPVVFEANSGPAMHWRGNVQSPVISGHIVSNDGPALLIDEFSDGSSATVEGMDWRANAANNNQSPSLQNNRHNDAGEIHLQRASGLFGANIAGRTRKSTGNTDGLLVSDASGADVRANISTLQRNLTYSARINDGDVRLFGNNAGVTLDSASAYAVEVFENYVGNPDTGAKIKFEGGEVIAEDSAGNETTLS